MCESEGQDLRIVLRVRTIPLVMLLNFGVIICGCIGSDETPEFRKIHVGMMEQEVSEILGKPDKVYERATAPKEYYVEGYTHEERAISNKVLIFIKGFEICYVYIGPSGTVEHIYIGGD